MIVTGEPGLAVLEFSIEGYDPHQIVIEDVAGLIAKLRSLDVDVALPAVTPSQHLTMMSLCSYRRAHGRNPTMREIASSLGIKSTPTVFDHLNALCRAGLLEARERRSRGYSPTEMGWVYFERLSVVADEEVSDVA